MILFEKCIRKTTLIERQPQKLQVPIIFLVVERKTILIREASKTFQKYFQIVYSILYFHYLQFLLNIHVAITLQAFQTNFVSITFFVEYSLEKIISIFQEFTETEESIAIRIRIIPTSLKTFQKTRGKNYFKPL